VVRGPGVPQGETRGELVANTDFAPTVADWAGLRPPQFVDGRSFDPLLSANPPARWREQLLIEMYKSHPFSGLRTSDAKTYVEYENGDRELYDLQADPYQLSSRHRVPRNVALREELHARLRALKDCSGQESCGAAEDEPVGKAMIR
jgi:arylsulfatase A-like enzyme